MRFLVGVIVLCITNVLAIEEWREVNTLQGPVRGRKHPEADVHVFYNIPYATAPTGENKFKPPLPPPAWTETFDAVDRHIICPQFPIQMPQIMPENLVQQEDCLVANVYVPDTEKKNLSVIIYVHGGGFIIGYGDMMRALHFMETKDMIVVTFNYRLSIHGFLCLGTEDVPGNAGSKDQVALLRWVQKNIASFGGNPDDVTLAGGSAGSASVDLIMLSKSAEGLFHRVIPESGGNLATFAVQRDPLDIAKNHAKQLNFTDVDDIYALEKFYKTAPLSLLTADPFLDRTDSTFRFAPCVERDTGDGAFLTESPLTILQNGNYRKLPMLYGFANMEGLLRVDFFEFWKRKMNNKFSDFLPADLKFDSNEEREEVANKIMKFYFGDKPVDKENILKYIDFFSDVFFTYPVLRAVKLHAEAGNNQVYLYEYSFVDDETPVVPFTNVRGANHCAQSAAVMDGNVIDKNESNLSEKHKNMKKTVREIWHNFVKTGTPVLEGSGMPAWPAAGADRAPHMSLGERLELRGALLAERTRFWDDIYQRYYRDAVPPPKPPPRPRNEL
ncbi:cholinesterase 1-like isoform X1 [Helicoverpa zea]|uniref:cholinesterase 1-like isoform X1 n=1 Tax=Helicoverpa zea TaxID=7113 RepID=UPI001F55DA02|nr:cholinesterase 1-like isoform X1 [Helicoverpa zea]